MFLLILYILAGPQQGERLQYDHKYNTPQECVEARSEVKVKILKDNPSVTEKDFDKNFILVCEKAKDKDSK